MPSLFQHREGGQSQNRLLPVLIFALGYLETRTKEFDNQVDFASVSVANFFSIPRSLVETNRLYAM